MDIIEKARRILELVPRIKAILESGGDSTPEQAKDLKESIELTNDFARDLVRAPNIVTSDPEVRRLIEGSLEVRAWKIEMEGGAGEEEKGAYQDDFWAADYTERMLSLPVTFTKERLPEMLAELMEEARRCFAFQNYTASIALCRTMLERTVTDLGVELGKIPPPTDADIFGKYPPYERFDIVLGKHSTIRRRIRKLYRYASQVIHGSEAADEEDARKAVGSSLKLVAEILDTHG